MSNSDIAYQVSLLLATRESKAPTKGWRWREGVVCFPEAKCPFCLEVVKSKAVWMITKTQLLGQAVPRNGQELIMDAPEHPHATPSAICFGTAYDPLQALFGALNPKSSWFDADNTVTGGIPEWLRGEYWRHDCTAARDAEEQGSGSVCSNCEESIDEDDSYSYDGDSYCESCFSAVAFNCYNCGGAESRDEANSDPNGYDWCNSCWERKFFKCEACDEVGSLEDQMLFDCDSYCSDCWNDKYFNCNGCYENFKLSEQRGDEGECSECYTPPATCSECGEESEVSPCEGCVQAPCSVCGATPTPLTCDDCNRHFCIDHEATPCPCEAQLTLPIESLESPSLDTHCFVCGVVSSYGRCFMCSKPFCETHWCVSCGCDLTRFESPSDAAGGEDGE